MGERHVPLTSGFMLTSILGFLISILFVMKLSVTWGFTFALVFLIMFIASIISMSKIEADDKYGLNELAIHDKDHYVKKRKRK
ncbi:hypothetical protein JW756_03445 [Candidatus Woesearchaeota archaeon]|nr:hypothetical protein [Candidatus Woesearchaeota archaeon]